MTMIALDQPPPHLESLGLKQTVGGFGQHPGRRGQQAVALSGDAG